MVYKSAHPGYGVTVKGARHTNFMDVPFLPLQAQSMFKPMLESANIDSQRMWRITCDYLLALFDKHLNNVKMSLLDGPSPDYPEVFFGSPRSSV
jgi:hypothetical protein